jgi:hypothetical protein
MAVSATCPGCSVTYNLADTLRGKKIRCKSCSEVFVVGGEESAIQTSPRPLKRAVRDEEDEDDRPQPRRPRKKRRSNAAVPLLIGGGIALLVLVFGGGLAVWAITRSRGGQKEVAAAVTTPQVPVAAANGAAQDPVAPPDNAGGRGAAPNPNPAAQPNNPNPQPVNPPVASNPTLPGAAPAQGPVAFELTNGQVSGFGGQMQVTVDYRCTSGSPAGRRLFLIIKASKAGGLRQNFYMAELKSFSGQPEGKIGGRGMTFGIEHGPFELWLGEGPPGVGLPKSDAELTKVSNVVMVAHRQMAPPGPGGMRPPVGPRRP